MAKDEGYLHRKSKDDSENVMTSQMSQREQGTSGIGQKAIDIGQSRQGSTRGHGHGYFYPCQTLPEPRNKDEVCLLCPSGSFFPE